MFKKFIVCECFLGIACHCLNMHFDKKNGNNSVFVIMNASEQIMQRSPFHVTYIVRCKDFVDFKIDLFKETSFRLTSIDCENTNEQQQDVDLDYEEDMYLSDYNDVDSDVFDSSCDDEKIELVKSRAFSSFLCFTQMRSLRRFCARCQEIFLMYFVSNLHHFSNDVFLPS